jgi:beta-lactamase regulating signal transducer with metallopeptidase domain
MSSWPLTSWLIENLAWASPAMLLVLAIRQPVARVFGAGVAYALWLIPALRLVAPPASWLTQLFNADLPALPPLLLFLDEPAMGTPDPAGGAVPWAFLLLALWVAGALLFLVYQALCYRAFLRRLSLSVRSAGTHGGLALVASGAVEGPLALGLLDRRIVVPVDFEQRYSHTEQRLALDHERHHHRRHDILANHLALIILALNWFNPIAWAAFRAFRADQELSCDAAIAAAAPPEVRSDYARALVKSASAPGLIAACPLNHADQLKRRLKMLNHHRTDRRRLWAGSAMTGALILTSMAFGGAGQAQDKGNQKEERRVTIIERHDSTHGTHAPGERREFQMRRDEQGNVIYRGLDAETQARIESCRNGNPLVNVDEGSGDRRTRVMLCDSGGGTAANRVEVLQRARSRIAEGNDLSGEAKQRVLAQIDAAIARARGN